MDWLSFAAGARRAPVVAVVLAAARQEARKEAREEAGTMAMLLDGGVRGHEAMVPIGRMLDDAHYAMWHPAATAGGFGAAAAAASVYGPDPIQLASALGNAGSVADGLWRMPCEPVMTKALHAAHAGFASPRERVSVARGGDLDASYPAHFGARVTAGGRAARAADVVGEPKNPMGRDALEAKLRALVAGLTPDEADEAAALVMDSADAAPVAPLPALVEWWVA